MNMKKILFLSFLIATITAQHVIAQNFDITIKVSGIQDENALLANYYGEKKYIKDTIYFDINGVGKIEGDLDYDPGIYLIAFPSMKNNYFDFILNENTFLIETDTADFVGNMKITNSIENKNFYEDQQLTAKNSQEGKVIQEQLEGLEKDSKNYKKLIEQLKTLKNEIEEKKNQVIKKYPNSLYAKALMIMKDTEIPDDIDSTEVYSYYKNHYFDNIDFTDVDLLRTPIFHKKVLDYIDKYTVPTNDSIIKACDLIIAKTSVNEDMYQYFVSTLTNKFARSKIMGQEAILVHLIEEYYLSGKASWASEELIQNFKKRVTAMKPTLIGKPAPGIIMTGLNDEKVSLQETVFKNDYTVIVWWNSTCGHCKKELPRLANMYDSTFVNLDAKIGIFAVSTEHEKEGWEKFIKEKNLDKKGWVHCLDLTNENPAQAWYDVRSTPYSFVLDKRGKIIARKLSIDSIEGLIKHEIEKAKQ